MLAILDLQTLVLKCLAVVGGAGVGFLGVGWGTKFLCRVLFHAKVPRPVLVTLRGLGMITFGMLVYLWAFGAGTTGGLGGGGGWWPFGAKGGPGTGSATLASSAEQPRPDAALNERTEAAEKAARDGQHTIRIRLLGGRHVTEQRFYLVDEEKEARTWPDLANLLEQRRAKDPALKGVEIVLFKDSVDRDNPAVTQLESWAKEHQMTPKLVFPAKSSGF